MKFLLVALLCVAAAAAYSEEDVEFALFEDAGIFAAIKEKIQKGFQTVLDRIRELIEKHRPLVANLKERLQALKEKVHDLLTQTGQKFRDALVNIRENLRTLLKDVLKKIGDGTEEVINSALYDADDDVSPFQQLIQRIKERIQAAWERLKDLVSQHKETLTTALKEKIEQVKQKLAELALEHGTKLFDKAREVALKIRDVIQEVLGKIGQKEEAALYAVEEEGETFLQALKRRIIERLQGYVELIKDKLKQVQSDFAEKVVPKVQEIIEKIKDLAKQSGEKLLVTAGEITQKIREVLTELKNKILGEAFYADDEEEVDQTIGQRILKRIQERLQGLLERAKTLISKHKEIAETFKEKIQEIATKIVELAKEKGLQLRQAARDLYAKIRQLVKDVLAKIGVSSYYIDIKEAARSLRDFFSSDAGVAALKENAANASPNTQTGILVKAFILASTPAALKDLVLELFKNVYYSPVGEYEDIRELVKRASAWLQTDEGVNAVRNYAKDLQTSHPVVLRLKNMLETASDSDVKLLFRDIFTIN